MLKRFIPFFIYFVLAPSFLIKADEGMWLPILLKRLNEQDMQKAGLKLSAEEIYSVNNSSLKDAVVNFGGYCTGEVISKEGLVLTNHHCGFDAIQQHSTVENDYLTNGFWAMTRAEEKPTPGLTVTFLVRMEDVTEQVLSVLKQGMSLKEKNDTITKTIATIEKKAVDSTHYKAEIKSFFESNAYYLFIYEVFTDIRMVGAPPSSVGKFGGDTDNWMWPRHTGDFSMFRIYTGTDGKPAEYHKDNIPYTPKHHLPVSLKGIEKNDFTMVMGYPGRTNRYLCSEGVQMALDLVNPARIKLREKRLALMKEGMDADPKVKIQYASKYARVSNYYKYFIGQNQGLRKLKVVQRKKEEEQKFQEWAIADNERKGIYENVVKDFTSHYNEYRKVILPQVYLQEAALAPEILMMAYQTSSFKDILASKVTGKEYDKAKEALKKEAEEFYKDFHAATDKKIFTAMLTMYYNDIPKALHPEIFKTVEGKYKGDFAKYGEFVYSKSLFASIEKFNTFLTKPDLKTLEKDPAFAAMNSIMDKYKAVTRPAVLAAKAKLDNTNNIYLKGILEMRKDDKLYPDANFTMRLTYGSIQDCVPGDAMYYNYYTTMEGIVQKEDSTNEEFIVPKKLLKLYKAKDYGKYADKKGHMPVCFISTNDITGGNSGSPVINGSGHLIGTAFDGNWEAMSGDIIFEPKLQRCISVDIRYILFMIDKYAGAGHLVREMTLVE